MFDSSHSVFAEVLLVAVFWLVEHTASFSTISDEVKSVTSSYDA